MQRVSYQQKSFAWGEIDPLLEGRTDLEQYQYALARARNVWLMPQGAARRRPGLEYLAEIATVSGKNAKLIPFEFSSANTYLIVLHGNGNIYMFDTEGVLVTTLTHPYTDSEIPEVSWSQNLGRLFLFHQNHKPRKIRRNLALVWGIQAHGIKNIPKYSFRDTDSAIFPGVDHVEKLGLSDWAATDEFTIIVDGHETAPIVFSGTPATTASNIQTALGNLSNVDAAGVTVAVAAAPASGGNFQYFTITMSGNNGSKFWTFIEGKTEFAQTNAATRTYLMDFATQTEGHPAQEDVWFDGVKATGILTLTGNALDTETVVIGSKTYTFQAVLTDVDGNVLIGATASDTIDNLIAAITLGAGAGTLYADSTTQHTQVTAAAGAGDTMDTTALEEGTAGSSIATTDTLTNGSWGAATLTGGLQKRGWPRCGIHFQGRLWMGGSKDVPTGIWASRSGNDLDFDITDDADDFGIFIDLNDDEVSTVNAFSINRHLQIFGSLNEHYIPKSDSEVITPTNASARRTTQRGSKQGLPVLNVDGATLFIDGTGRQLREFLFNESEAAYTSENIQRFAGHIFDNAASVAYKRSTSVNEPDYVLVVDRDLDGDTTGELAVYSVLRGENISGWSKSYTFRGIAARYGVSSSGFWGVAVVNEEIYVLTKRDLTSGGTTDKYHLERFVDGLELDMAKYANNGASSASGLAHLNSLGSAVAVVDGTLRSVMVSGGSATLSPAAANSWQVGYDFPLLAGAPHNGRVWMQTLPVPVELASGSVMPSERRVGNVWVRIKDTSHIKVGGIETVPRQEGTSVLDDPLPERTGVYSVKGFGGIDHEGRIDITQDMPFPMFLLSVAQETEVK